MIKFNEIKSDMTENFEIVALITKFMIKPTKSGKDYIDMELTTKEGVMSAKKWTLEPDDKLIKVGNVIEATASVNVFQGRVSLVIQSMKSVSIDPSEFTLTVIEPVDALKEEFNGYVNEIENPQLQNVVKDLIQKNPQFFDHPAAKSNHHAEENGLLYHTTRMMRAAKALCECYNKVEQVVNKDLVLTAIIFHDIGKILEMEKTATGAGEYTKYSLIGHIVLGAMMIDEYNKMLGMLDDELAFQLEHIVLSHHGKLEYGSPVLPATPEAILVSMVDNLDAKLFTVQNEELRLQEGEMSKDSNFALEGARVYKPIRK